MPRLRHAILLILCGTRTTLACHAGSVSAPCSTMVPRALLGRCRCIVPCTRQEIILHYLQDCAALSFACCEGPQRWSSTLSDAPGQRLGFRSPGRDGSRPSTVSPLVPIPPLHLLCLPLPLSPQDSSPLRSSLYQGIPRYVFLRWISKGNTTLSMSNCLTPTSQKATMSSSTMALLVGPGRMEPQSSRSLRKIHQIMLSCHVADRIAENMSRRVDEEESR